MQDDQQGKSRSSSVIRERGNEQKKDQQRPNKRKKREQLNCAECRRLKLKCDRTVPCENCVKRGCNDLCPDGARSATKPKSAETVKLQQQIDALVDLLGQRGVTVSLDQQNEGMEGSSSNPHDRAKDYAESSDYAASSTTSRGTSLATGLPQQSLPPPLPPPGTQTQTPAGAQAPSVYPIPQEPLHWSPTASTSSSHATITYPQLSGANPNQNQASTSFHHNALGSRPSTGTTSALPMAHQDATVTFSPTAEPSHGTLVISQSGRSKYLGPSAASEWLKDQEVMEESRPNSPPTNAQSRSSTPTRTGHTIFFPETSNQSSISTASLLDDLPTRDEANTLIDCYYRYFGWSYNIVTREHLEVTLQSAYHMREFPHQKPDKAFDAQKLGLLFIVLALGATHNLELSPNDQIAEDFCTSARNCLTKGHFMTRNTLAGVQTLSLMAHYLLQTDRGRDGDASWPLWGLAMRIGQAMGLHRDGGKWNLPDDVVEDRRRVFWECHTAEVLQANCFSRPGSISPDFVDTLFPTDSRGYHALKFELCKLSERVLYTSLTVHGTSYERVRELYDQLQAFEKRIPYHLRCRAALVSLPSQYADAALAEADSPPLNRRDLRRTFESYWLSLIVSETIINLHRPYFISAIVEGHGEPTRSPYGQAFLSVMERCNVLVQIVSGLYEAHPAVTARHWWCWYHAFNSAVCMGTLLLMSPRNDFAPLAMKLIDQVIAAYTSVIQLHASPRLVQNLRWLLRLRQRGVDRQAQSQSAAAAPGQALTHAPAQGHGIGTGTGSGSTTGMGSGEGILSSSGPMGVGVGVGQEDLELDTGLLGWRTRLIERSGIKNQKATTVSVSSTTPTGISPLDIERVIQSMPKAVQEHIAPDTFISSSSGHDAQTNTEWLNQSTDQLLHDFWDPTMVFQDPGGMEADPSATNWWSWLAPGPQ